MELKHNWRHIVYSIILNVWQRNRSSARIVASAEQRVWITIGVGPDSGSQPEDSPHRRRSAHDRVKPRRAATHEGVLQSRPRDSGVPESIASAIPTHHPTFPTELLAQATSARLVELIEQLPRQSQGCGQREARGIDDGAGRQAWSPRSRRGLLEIVGFDASHLACPPPPSKQSKPAGRSEAISTRGYAGANAQRFQESISWRMARAFTDSPVPRPQPPGKRTSRSPG